MFKTKLPKFEYTASSMFTWAVIWFSLAIGSAIAQIMLQFIVGVFGLLSIVCLIGSLIMLIINRGK